MKFTIWNNSYKLALATFVAISTVVISNPAVAATETEHRLELLKSDFLDTNNMRPFSYYVDEFLTIIEENPQYVKGLLFKFALRDDTPDEVFESLRESLQKVRNSKSLLLIKTRLYLSIRKWVRKDTHIPTDLHAEQALEYHVGLNN